MSWRTPLLDKNYLSGAAVLPYRFCKFGSSDTAIVTAAAATDAIIGVSGQVGAPAAGQQIDITLMGIGEVTLAANLARGVLVTSDANGAAVAAATANNRIAGTLLMSGVAGDVVPVMLAIGNF